MRAVTGAGHSEFEQTVKRGNLYGIKSNRRQPGICNCCKGQINKGDIVYKADKNDGFKKVYAGIFHIDCFEKL